jgi:DNA-binding transcriptional MerR regulator
MYKRDSDIKEAEDTLTIRQMADLSGMSEYTLRYYEKTGLIEPIPRDESSGHRRYSRDTVQMVVSLSCLRASGFSLDEMRLYLQQRKHSDVEAAKQKALFLAHAEAVAEEIRKLQIRQRYLSGKAAYWDARLNGDLALAEQIAVENREIAKTLK